ncbi:rab11 family-interacting protein 4-like [Hydractinia symbiolongicarpus]|uniref:rab11 family-interacting protein 4-like n=1 Tax=Hydractinia symbiolongicarpus TaxID=13093 RepID=UPI0025506E04|nr:rab11 family-interacting protein 4-like [Hydractinia symbiolongicarpus]
MGTEALLPNNFGKDGIENGFSNNDLLLHLKPVFDTCDYNGDGYVKIQDLIDLGQQHTVENGEELKLILQQLDTNGKGRICFDEFCNKIRSILEVVTPKDNNNKEIKYDDLSPVEEENIPSIFHEKSTQDEQRARSFTDSEGFYEEMDSISASTTSTNDCYGDMEEHHSTPLNNNLLRTPTNFFTRMKQDTSIYSTYPPNGKRPRKSRKSLFEMRQRQLSRTSEYQSQEEGFEAFGEGHDYDSLSSEPVAALPLHLSPSDSFLTNRRLSGTQAACQLRQVQSARTSLHGSMEEIKQLVANQPMSLSDGEGDFMFLSAEIKKLSSQLTIMKMDQENHDDKQKRIREENKMLVNRINALEEQLIDQKATSLQVVEGESQKYRKELQKLQRENENHIDKLQMKLHEAELEIQNLKTVEPMLRKEIESSLEERREAQRKVEELQTEIIEKEKEIEQLKYKLKARNDDLERERNDRADEVSLLTQEIENMKYMKNAALNQFDERNDLMKQLELLKRENDVLKASKDDLKNELVQQASMMDLQKEHTLADELAHADKSDVLDALRAEETENHRLRQYVDQLLILIMQSNPLLLEK